MVKDAAKIKFEPRPLKIGLGWHIVATYPSGLQEHIIGFKTQAEATEWLANGRRQAWLKARGYA